MSDSSDESAVIEVGIGIVVRIGPNSLQNVVAAPEPNVEVLITRRPARTVFPGWWEFPGGKVHEGEDARACIRRELLEEVGIEVEVGESLPEVEHSYAHGRVRLHPMLCRLTPASPPPSNLHVDAHLWCPIEALSRYNFPPANDAIIASLRAVLSRTSAR